MTAPFLVLHQSSPDRLCIHNAIFRGTQMEHALQFTVAADVTHLVLLSSVNQAMFAHCWIGRLYS